METRYKHINFSKIDSVTGKTSIWACCNNRSIARIGTVKWYSAWRQYCYFSEMSVYSVGCLEDIIDFVNQVNAQRKLERQKEKVQNSP